MNTEWLRRNSRAVMWSGAAVSALILLILFVALARLIDPAPPNRVRMATGFPGGAYAASGARFAERLARDGITVELVESSGSGENFALLTAPDSDIDFAILQGGVGVGEPGSENLVSLAGIFLEPVWVFVREGAAVSDLRGLAGMRIAAGGDGSGTRALVNELLAENGVLERVSFLPLSGDDAASALLEGRADAAIYVSAPDRPYVERLLRSPRARLMSFDRADAYGRRHRYLSALTLPQGVISLTDDVPGADTTLIAPAAALVAREDLHPAIQELLVEAAAEIYRQGDILSEPGAFPSRDLVPFALSEQAMRYFERGGPGFLQRNLPFWAANLIERLWVLIIPLATLLYPLVQAAPPIYRWQVRRRITIWYRDLRRLEREGVAAGSPEELERVRGELSRILAEVGRLEVPLPYNDDVYRLRGHIRLVDDIVSGAATSGDAAL